MYAKSTRPSAKREVQKERSAKRDDQTARFRRAQTCERSELRTMRMCPPSGQIFLNAELESYFCIFVLWNDAMALLTLPTFLLFRWQESVYLWNTFEKHYFSINAENNLSDYTQFEEKLIYQYFFSSHLNDS